MLRRLKLLAQYDLEVFGAAGLEGPVPLNPLLSPGIPGELSLFDCPFGSVIPGPADHWSKHR